MTKRGIMWGLPVLLLLGGCGKYAGDVSIDDVCDLVVECGYATEEICQRYYGQMVLSDDCLEAIMSGGCEGFDSGAFNDVCWPPCELDDTRCVAELLYECKGEEGLFVFDCYRICIEQGEADGTCMTAVEAGTGEYMFRCVCGEF